jgi:hypothetical protein
MLEQFGVGEFRIGPLKVTRKYIQVSCSPDDVKRGEGDRYTYYTLVENLEKPAVA